MAPMKRPAGGKKNIVSSKCKEIEGAIYECDIPERVQEMLAGSLSSTLGALAASRHPMNARFVAMIGQVFAAHKASLEKDVVEKEAAVAALTPAKGDREAAVEAAKATLAQRGEALDKAKQDVKEIAASVKEATATLKAKTAEQDEGAKALGEVEGKLANLQRAEKESLEVLLAGDPEADEKQKMMKVVIDASKKFGFDSSLMEASIKVLEKRKDDRGDGFDETCINQLKASFTNNIAQLEQQIAEATPGQNGRVAAVEQAAAAKGAAEKTQEELKAASEKAKEEKEAAAEAVKSAKQSLDDFLPDLKAAGDALDESRANLAAFIEGPLTGYTELKDLTEDTFKEPEPVIEEPEPAAEEEGPAAKKARTEEPVAAAPTAA